MKIREPLRGFRRFCSLNDCTYRKKEILSKKFSIRKFAAPSLLWHYGRIDDNLFWPLYYAWARLSSCNNSCKINSSSSAEQLTCAVHRNSDVNFQVKYVGHEIWWPYGPSVGVSSARSVFRKPVIGCIKNNVALMRTCSILLKIFNSFFLQLLNGPQ
jgi:hypothetical protein